MKDQPASPSDLRAHAMRLLARREYSVRDLRDRLCAKWPGQDGISRLADELVEALVMEGSLSDERFVESFVRSRLQRSQGPVKIRAELRKHQIPMDLVDAALEREMEDWVEYASAWLARHHEGALAYEDRAKFYRRLLNRGFSHEQAMRALEQYNPA